MSELSGRGVVQFIEWRANSTRKFFFFFFNDTATTEIYTLSLHDALPISPAEFMEFVDRCHQAGLGIILDWTPDRKSTRLNSSHGYISYAVFCLKKKNT